MDIEGMKMKMKCQVCGSEKVKVKTETEVYEYKGHKIPIDNFTRTICDNCGEEVASDESVKRSIPILRDAQRIIDGLLTSRNNN